MPALTLFILAVFGFDQEGNLTSAQSNPLQEASCHALKETNSEAVKKHLSLILIYDCLPIPPVAKKGT